jgi:GT2 family glycosyltransferase
MITTLGIPVLNRADFLLRCVTSVDHPIENLVIINNSGGKDTQVGAACAQIEARELPNAALFDTIKIETKKNLGCGPSWNHIFRNYPGPWLIVGNDIAFLPGSIALLDAAYEAEPDAEMVFGDGYNAFIMTQAAVERVGYLDENFYPAYYEDLDHCRRAKLSGAKLLEVNKFKRIHGDATHPEDSSRGSNTVRADPELNRRNNITTRNNEAFYVSKWGGWPGSERFNTPFNKDVPVSFWEIDPVHRKKNDLW